MNTSVFFPFEQNIFMHSLLHITALKKKKLNNITWGFFQIST